VHIFLLVDSVGDRPLIQERRFPICIDRAAVNH
jgi:hypothetical protein